MLITVDIGNTNIVIGAFEGEKLIKHFRLSTLIERTSDEYGILLMMLFSNSGISKDSLEGAVISTVVPQMKEVFIRTIVDYAGIRPLVVEPGVKTGMPILTDNPKEVGADRIVNAVAAYNIHKCALIVVDFGTAITFDYVTVKGEYAGGVIAPGIRISAEALFERTAQLPHVEFSKPAYIVGKNTVDSVRSGLFYGYVSLLDGIIERMKKEVGGRPKVVATGGYARIFKGEVKSIDEFDEYLILKGLKTIYEVNRQ